jgi:hypothetical protein
MTTQEGTPCVRSRVRTIAMFGASDKPLGRFLIERCLNERLLCRACGQDTTAHV